MKDYSDLLKIRMDRLRRFVEIDAPMALIAQECFLVSLAYFRGFWRLLWKMIRYKWGNSWLSFGWIYLTMPGAREAVRDFKKINSPH